MNKALIGKTALVTGASSGIGYQVCLMLNELGLKVYAAARRTDKMQDLASKGIKPIFLDLTDESSIEKTAQSIIEENGSIDVLINNAGYGSYGAVENVPIQEVRRQFDVNLFGLAKLTQMVLPKMRENHFGKIVNTSSMGGRFTAPFGTWYHATKYAIEAFSDGLRLEVKPFGIDVMIVEPGLIQTDWGIIAADNLRKQSADTAYKVNATHTADYFDGYYKKPGLTKPEVIAKTIVKAATSRNPKKRYLKGKFSHLFVTAKHFLSDSLLDKIIYMAMGLKSKL